MSEKKVVARGHDFPKLAPPGSVSADATARGVNVQPVHPIADVTDSEETVDVEDEDGGN